MAATLFKSIGLDDKTIENLLKNESKSKVLETLIEQACVKDGCEKQLGNLLLTVCTTYPSDKHRSLLAEYIGSRKLKHVAQVEAGIEFLKKNLKADSVDIADFERATGVGVDVSEQEIKEAVTSLIESKKTTILGERYATNIGSLLGALRSHDRLKWGDAKLIKKELDDNIAALLGPKTEQDEVKKKKPAPAAKKEEKPAAVAQASSSTAEESNDLDEIKNMKQFIARELDTAVNPPHILKKHMEVTGGRVRTRFPPEPNGYLHIGHAKSMNLNFGYAQEVGGDCFLRYDDTNPEAESTEYINSIRESVLWMGWRPFQITYSSEYFPQLHELAVNLIKAGKAYVDLSSKEEIRQFRESKTDSRYRNTSVEENLRLFEDMRIGKFQEGAAVLRLKMDMQHANPNMRDVIAYRIKFAPHPHVGDLWCIYPTYDYTHCLVDSLEDITLSMCTLEFEIRRDSYYWLIDACDMYKPHVYEFSRLNITYTVLSKRKLNRLVMGGFVHGWNDPRLLTIDGLKRRGYTPEAINTFCRKIGVTRNENVIEMNVLEHFCRKDLDVRCNRAFAVLHPLKVTITNWPEQQVDTIAAPNHPTLADRGTRNLPFSRVIYIEQSDFRMQDSKDYYGLAPNKEVGLRYAHNITCTEVVKDAEGNVVELLATVDVSKKNRPKGHIHWVAQPAPGVEPAAAEVRLYEYLFTIAEPGSADDWLEKLNPASEVIISKAFVEPALATAAAYEHMQFERLGFFTVDPDTTEGHLVFNRTVTLKESYPKFAEAKKA